LIRSDGAFLAVRVDESGGSGTAASFRRRSTRHSQQAPTTRMENDDDDDDDDDVCSIRKKNTPTKPKSTFRLSACGVVLMQISNMVSQFFH
jgi:hypothetical protein